MPQSEMQAPAMPGHLIRRLHQRSTQVFARALADAGIDLTPVQFAALDAIAAHPGLDQAGVAARIAYDRATIGGVIDRLEQKGLVARQVSAQDRRARDVRLTPQGESVYAAALPRVAALQTAILPGLTGEETAHFLKLAQKALAAADG